MLKDDSNEEGPVPSDEDFEKYSWNVKKMKERRHEFNYESAEEVSGNEHTTTYHDAKLMEGMWR